MLLNGVAGVRAEEPLCTEVEVHASVDGRRRSAEAVDTTVGIEASIVVAPVGELNGVQLRVQTDLRPELGHRFHLVRQFRDPAQDEHRNAEREPVGITGFD